jgi:hypothetical protein
MKFGGKIPTNRKNVTCTVGMSSDTLPYTKIFWGSMDPPDSALFLASVFIIFSVKI